jgi:CheY-like chemotaxis protein
MTATAATLVLIVDDDVDVLEIGRLALEAGGFRVVCCGDPDEALVAMAAEPPALVISDLVMQRLDAGFALVRRMRADQRLRSIPVLMMSGVNSQHGFDFLPRDANDLRAMQIDGFLEKPVRGPRLVTSVREALARRAGATDAGA